MRRNLDMVTRRIVITKQESSCCSCLEKRAGGVKGRGNRMVEMRRNATEVQRRMSVRDSMKSMSS